MPRLLYSFYLRLRPLEAAIIQPSQGLHAHAVALGLMARSSPVLAQRVHDLPRVKPFTVSPLLGRFEREASGLRVSPEETYSLRLTALEEDVFCALLDGALRLGSEPLRLEQARFLLAEALTVPGSAPLAACTSYEELLEAGEPTEELSVAFLSPCTFRTKDDRNVLHPEPRLVLRSWLQKWNAFAPMAIEAAAMPDVLRPASTRVAVRSMVLGNHPEMGFCGTARFRVAAGASADQRRALAALASFALFGGTGAKTAMGMGQSRRLEHAHPLPGRAGLGFEEERPHLPGDQG